MRKYNLAKSVNWNNCISTFTLCTFLNWNMHFTDTNKKQIPKVFLCFCRRARKWGKAIAQLCFYSCASLLLLLWQKLRLGFYSQSCHDSKSDISTVIVNSFVVTIELLHHCFVCTFMIAFSRFVSFLLCGNKYIWA